MIQFVKNIPAQKAKDVCIGLAMIIVALFSMIFTGYYRFPIVNAIIFIGLMGSLPWVIYNFLAFVSGREYSHISELASYWIEIAFSLIP